MLLLTYSHTYLFRSAKTEHELWFFLPRTKLSSLSTTSQLSGRAGVVIERFEKNAVTYLHG